MIEVSNKQIENLTIQHEKKVNSMLDNMNSINSDVTRLREENQKYRQEINTINSAGDYLRSLDTKRINFLLSLLNGSTKIGINDYKSKSLEYNIPELIDKELIQSINLGTLMNIKLTDIGAVVVHRFVSQ